MELSNRKAYYEYSFKAKYIAGMVLQGTEIKSIRSGKVSFNDSYCIFDKGELHVKSLHIAEYNFGNINNHEPMQERKLLLKKKELRKLENQIKEKGFTIIPLKIFISEKEKPDTVVNLLNQYFDLMAKEIIAQNGLIDKFIGDCVMAVFKGPFHLDRAIDACLAIRNKIEELPANLNFSPKVSVGINSGEMISGNIGSATLRRLDYTVIGDSVNTAQRLQGTATTGQIVINQACYEKVKQSFNCKKMGNVTLKNKADDVILYEVVN